MAKGMKLVDLDDSLTGEQDGQELETELEKQKRASAGKDKKISEYQREIQRLQELVDTGIDSGQGSEFAELLASIREKAGQLKELEKSLAEREQALAYAVERKISPTLALGNAGRLEQFKAEVDQLYEDVKTGIFRDMSGNRDKVTGDPGRAKRKEYEYPRSGLDLAHLGRMSGAELERIPPRIRERLQGGK